MFRFWEYCFYRICKSKLLQEVELTSLVYIDACSLISLLQIFNLLTVLHILNLSGVLVDIVFPIMILLTNHLFVFNEKKYMNLCDKYDEKADMHRKDFVVWTYVSISVLLFFGQLFTKITI